MPEFLPRLRQGVPIGKTADGQDIFPHEKFILLWQQLVELLEEVPAIAEALQTEVDAAAASAAAAQAAANAAQSAADDVSTATSLENSWITGFTPPLISADSAGNITIANHQRQYAGEPLPAPVNVTGGALPTAFVNPDVVRVYYDQASRAGGAVTYLTTLDPTVAAQSGDRHSVGAVEIPAAGSQDGDPVRPPGYIPLQ
jgi:hypothetical protein